MSTGHHFPFRFDVAQLQADLARVASHEWAPHFNEHDYGGVWRGVALRSISGHARDLLASGTAAAFRETEVLERCPYFREALAVFQCPLKSARLLSLAPGSFIREHRDRAVGYESGEVRIHIPIQTGPGVEFYVSGRRLLLEPGHCYYIDVDQPHRVNNRGPEDRIHLVIDAEVNDWVHALFRQADAEAWEIPHCPPPERNIDDFRRLVLRDEALQVRLRDIRDRKDFTSAVLRLGAELGFEFNEADIGAAFAAAVTADDDRVEGWTPARVSFADGAPMAEWVWTGGRPFTAPFFADSLQEILQQPFPAFFRHTSPLSAARSLASLPPSGLVFHMSRCGSTLVSRMLAACPRVSAISEAEPVDEILRSSEVDWLRWMAAALGQPSTSSQTHFILKLHPWHIHNLAVIRRAFPDTPWVFLYRDPLEVLSSHVSCPSLLSVPGAVDSASLRLTPEETGLDRIERCVRVIARFLESAAGALDDPNAIFVNYRELPDAVFTRIAPHFGLNLTAGERAQMEEMAKFDSKRPGFWFENDPPIKQNETTARLRELSRQWLDPLIARIESRPTFHCAASDKTF